MASVVRSECRLMSNRNATYDADVIKVEDKGSVSGFITIATLL